MGMIYDDENELRVFEINLSQQKSEKVTYTRNATVTVVCKDAQRAIELALKEFPDGRIWQLNHRGGWTNHRLVVDS